jgi:hypothetical protein
MIYALPRYAVVAARCGYTDREGMAAAQRYQTTMLYLRFVEGHAGEDSACRPGDAKDACHITPGHSCGTSVSLAITGHRYEATFQDLLGIVPTAGDRTINRYRAIALRRLGPMCPTGIVAPEKEEIDATLGDWMNEVERVQLMLRLTPRLREKYQD